MHMYGFESRKNALQSADFFLKSYCYVWQKEADIANKSGKQMCSISFQGMLDLCTNMPIACNMHWLVVNTNIYKYPNYNSHLLVVRPIFFTFYFGKPLVQVMRIWYVSNRCAPFFFHGMLDFRTNMPIATCIDWWFVRYPSLFTLATLWCR